MDWLLPLFLSFLRFENRAKKDRTSMLGREKRQEKAGGLGTEKQIHSNPGLGALGLCCLTSEHLYRNVFNSTWFPACLPPEPISKLNSYLGPLQEKYNSVAVLVFKLARKQKHWSTNNFAFILNGDARGRENMWWFLLEEGKSWPKAGPQCCWQGKWGKMGGREKKAQVKRRGSFSLGRRFPDLSTHPSLTLILLTLPNT